MRKIFYIIGKSSTGKNMIYEALMDRDDLGLMPLVPWTTRPMRSGEQDGVEYHFTDAAGLARLEDEGRVIEKRIYHTVQGEWTYFTVDEPGVRSADGDLLGIGTLESYVKIREFYGPEKVIPIYIETGDRQRLERAMKREGKQEKPDYEEMCRRFLADQKDFSEERLAQAGITRRFNNDEDRSICIGEAASFILLYRDRDL